MACGTPWRRIATAADKLVELALQGDALYVLTQAQAPRRKLVKVDLARGQVAGAPEVVPEPQDSVLEDFSLTPTAIAAAAVAAAQGHTVLKLKVARADRSAAQELALLAAVRGAADASAPGAVRLRLDANGEMDPASLAQRLRECAPFGIELVEGRENFGCLPATVSLARADLAQSVD